MTTGLAICLIIASKLNKRSVPQPMQVHATNNDLENELAFGQQTLDNKNNGTVMRKR
jgi:hypothetical protein